MKKISTKEIKIGEKAISVSIYSIEKDESTKDFSRVYVVVADDEGKIALIYNSKRKIWGFPGGHSEEGETINETAQRECVEEIKYSIKDCEPKYALSNKLDDNKEETQIICFAKVDRESDEFVDENESVKEIKFVNVESVKEEIGNADLWEDILQGFKEWLSN
jgi:ADP-ribose pyrophosphatase YjhB (NUDIX family)